MAFSFAELLVLLDVDAVPALTAPMPTPHESALRMGGSPLLPDSFPDARGALRFREGLNHLFAAPLASLDVTPFHVHLKVWQFPDADVWRNMHGWVSEYLADNLAKGTKSQSRTNYRAFFGDGIVADYASLEPKGHIAAADARMALIIRRDQHPIRALCELLGVAFADLAAAQHADANWRQLACSKPLRVEVRRVADRVGLRWHAQEDPLAYRVCQQWFSDWRSVFQNGNGMHRDDDSGVDLPILQLGNLFTAEFNAAHPEQTNIDLPLAWLA